MIRNIVRSILLFLVLTFTSHDASYFSDAFAIRSVNRFPNSYTSSLKMSMVEMKTTSALSATKTESALDEMNTSNTMVELISVANENGDRNEDADVNSTVNDVVTTEKTEGVDSESDDLMEKIKESGVAGVISYASWELAFWTVSVPVCVLGYKEVTGHWPDLKNNDDISKLGAEAFAFVNFARFAVPLRIGLALSTTPWIQENIVDVYLVDEEIKNENEEKNEKSERKENFLRSGETSDEEIEHSNDQSEIAVEHSEMDCSEGKDNSHPKANRFRIRSRLRNLISRVLRRKKRQEKE